MMRRLALAASALTGLPLLAAWLISHQVLHPRPRVEDHDLSDVDLPADEVSFPSRDGTRLAGWFIPAKAQGPSPGIVLSHGWARSRAELLPHANFLHRAGFAVLGFDYRHRGKSDGDAVTMGLRERDDLRAALDVLATRPEVDAGRVGLLGMSMGSVVSILVAAADERVRALVTECPYGSRDAIMRRALRHYTRLPLHPLAPFVTWMMGRRLGEPWAVPDAKDVAWEISPRPLFVIGDERDAVIGSDETERVFEAALEPKRFWLIPGADHARGWQAASEEYERRVLAFLREALVEPGPVAAPSANAPSEEAAS